LKLEVNVFHLTTWGTAGQNGPFDRQGEQIIVPHALDLFQVVQLIEMHQEEKTYENKVSNNHF